jgi:rubredoxin
VYWDRYGPEKWVIYSETEWREAKKDHECCECGSLIKKGTVHLHSVKLEDDTKVKGKKRVECRRYRMCPECEKDWGYIQTVFREHGIHRAPRIFGALWEAVQDAFEADFLPREDPLVRKWVKGRESRIAVSQMRMHSTPLF